MVRLLLALVISVALPGAATAGGMDHAAFDGLLRAHVQPTRGGVATVVDYAGFARDRAALRAYLGRAGAVSRAEFARWSKNDQLAFLINVYNAATIELVLTRYPGLDSIKDLGGLFSGPWSKDVVTLFGRKVSLDDVEHGWIRDRGQFRDPRIHFAVNCASIGCPALRREAYVGSRLDAQLDDQTERFLRDRTRNRLRRDRLEVSKLFDWYAEDFEKGWRGARSVRQFLADRATALGLTADQARRLRRGDLDIEHTRYDWKLNATR